MQHHRPYGSPPTKSRTPPDRSFATHIHSQSTSDDDDSLEPAGVADYRTLDQLWGSIRQQKEVKMAKEPSKIKSFEAVTPEEEEEEVPIPSPPATSRPALRRRRSIVSYKESGTDMVAILDMQGLSKQDIHVSYQRDRLVVTWEMVEVLDVEENGHLVRERRHKVHTRHIELPPGTKFERVRAAMGSRHLVLRYPNPRFSSEKSRTVDEY